MIVELVDAVDIFISDAAGGGGGRVGGELPGEDHIFGRKGVAVMLDHPLLEAP